MLSTNNTKINEGKEHEVSGLFELALGRPCCEGHDVDLPLRAQHLHLAHHETHQLEPTPAEDPHRDLVLPTRGLAGCLEAQLHVRQHDLCLCCGLIHIHETFGAMLDEAFTGLNETMVASGSMCDMDLRKNRQGKPKQSSEP